jgi:hypothetical protein
MFLGVLAVCRVKTEAKSCRRARLRTVKIQDAPLIVLPTMQAGQGFGKDRRNSHPGRLELAESTIIHDVKVTTWIDRPARVTEQREYDRISARPAPRNPGKSR